MRDIINTMADIIMQHLENFGVKKHPARARAGCFLFFGKLHFQTSAIRTMKEMIAIRTASRAQPRLILSDERHQNDEGDDRHQDGKQGAAEVDEVEKLIEGFLFALLVSDRT